MRRNHLLQLLADNRRTFTPIAQRIQRAADGSEATVYLYDPIMDGRDMAEWYGGVCPQDFVPEFRALDVGTINLRIKCGGGDVFAAEAMAQAIRDSKANVIAHIDGLCASAATNLACACSEVVISAQSEYMVHEAWTIALGNKRDMRKVADLLQQVDDTTIVDYVRRTGQTSATVTAWVEAETWFTAQGAIDAGFADRMAVGNDKTAADQPGAAAAWNLRAYGRAAAGRAWDAPAPTPEPAPPAQPPAPPAHASADHRHRQAQRINTALRLASIA